MNKELIYKLLWATIEEYAGLWELHWEINSTLKITSSSNKDLAKNILLLFIEKDLVKLYYDRWGGEDQLEEISQHEAIEVLDEDKFWIAPEINDLCVKVGSTKKGERYYNEELIGDFI